MPRRPGLVNRWLTAATWPVGIVLTSWDYMWRTTPMRRRERPKSIDGEAPRLLRYPPRVDDAEVQGQQDGCGPLFHRLYRVHIRQAGIGPDELMQRLRSDLNQASPTTFARFSLVRGERGRMRVGDEYVVRMPGPWDGPVRVIELGPRSFRLATLQGHLEAGQIEFRADESDGLLVFEIESWARSASSLVHLLYHHLRMAKEVQAHMWISFLEAVVRLSGGRMNGPLELLTDRIGQSPDELRGLLGDAPEDEPQPPPASARSTAPGGQEATTA